MSEPIRVPLIPECASCIIGSLKILVPLLSSDQSAQADYFALAYRMLSEGYEERLEPAPLSVKIYRELYTKAGVTDPYSDIKRISKEAALKALIKIEQNISPLQGYQRLRACIAASIAGNVIDFNTAGHDPDLNRLVEIYDEIINEGFAIDASDSLWTSLNSQSDSLLFIADNAGEVILDIPLIRLFKEMKWSVTFVVKGKPMINDATREDVEGTEIEELTTVVDSGAWAHGVPLKDVSREFLELVEKSGLIISKGQANIETFPEIQSIYGIETYYLTRAKCPHISKAVGAKKGDSVVVMRSQSNV